MSVAQHAGWLLIATALIAPAQAQTYQFYDQNGRYRGYATRDHDHINQYPQTNPSGVPHYSGRTDLRKDGADFYDRNGKYLGKTRIEGGRHCDYDGNNRVTGCR